MSKTPWTPVALGMLPDCEIVSCDPSLTALGITWLLIEDGHVTVKGAETLSTAPTERKGWDDTFLRATVMESLVYSLLDQWDTWSNKVIGVHEGPPTGGGDFVRTEATILTGYGFRSAATDLGLTVVNIVTPQSHKKLITGNHLAKKTEYAKHIKELLPNITGGELITNEAKRDALGVGIYTAHRILQTQQS